MVITALAALRAELLARCTTDEQRALVARSLDAALDHVRAALLAAGVRP
jgi:hypothetical protein